MMSRHLLMMGAVCVGLTGWASAAPKVGESAPQIGAAHWWNLPAGMKRVGLPDLKGQIVMLEFWATWCGPCRENVPYLNELQKKYGPKGLVVVALSEEKASQVGRSVKLLKMSYIVGSGARETARVYGIKAFPTMYLIGPDGQVEWTGTAKSDELEKSIERILKDNPPTSKDTLAERAAKAAFKKAEKAYQKMDYSTALKLYEQVAEDFKDSKLAKQAKTKVKAIRSDKKIMAGIRAEKERKDCEGWLLMARNLARSGREQEAVEYYDRIIKEYPESKYALTAEEEKEKLTS